VRYTGKKSFISFDGGFREEAEFQRPDRYRMIEDLPIDRKRIARGGGFSYAAASFGGGSLVLEMNKFNRVLGFSPENKLIEVEAGMKLVELLGFTSARMLWLPVMPGYPEITVGGCIAANAHGKNPHKHGVFKNWIEDITIHHPRNGIVKASRKESSNLFELTCGGYGLTGVILSATLRLEELSGFRLSKSRIPVGGLIEAVQILRENRDSDFAYSFGDVVPRKKSFGRGNVNVGRFVPDLKETHDTERSYHHMTSDLRARSPFSLWRNGLISRVLTSAYLISEKITPEYKEIHLFDSMFPFANRAVYFYAFGKQGLAEYQALIPYDQAERFINELQNQIMKLEPPSLMISMKLFSGVSRYLQFDGKGVCITLNLIRSKKTIEFLSIIDQLTILAGGRPHIIKDSRLPQSVVNACYPEYDVFRSHLMEYDPEHVFQSELSVRLNL
jgi:decaprenylphospho-beta-D-ribofuranose 2-oxidase